MTVTVHIRHIRAARICSRGARDWWSHHGLSWSAFLAHGISADVLEKTGDPHALKVVALAREEAHGQ